MDYFYAIVFKYKLIFFHFGIEFEFIFRSSSELTKFYQLGSGVFSALLEKNFRARLHVKPGPFKVNKHGLSVLGV